MLLLKTTSEGNLIPGWIIITINGAAANLQTLFLWLCEAPVNSWLNFNSADWTMYIINMPFLVAKSK